MIKILFLPIILLFLGCSKSPQILRQELPKTYLLEEEFTNLPNEKSIDYNAVLQNFQNNCKTKKAKKIYGVLCKDATKATDAKQFFQNNFKPFKISTDDKKTEGLLTGYYEPKLNGSLKKTELYRYPIYKTPKDLVEVDLSSIYPALKNYRLRGRVIDNKLIPYYDRSDADKIESEVICYTDSKIDLFFLEVQGSGRVELDNNQTIFVGYDNQNGHKYNSIGKYLIDKGEIKREDVSLQSIKEWLEQNPSRVDEVLNYNASLVFFEQNNSPATGSLGVELTPSYSIAVDPRYIPLGSLVYLDAKVDNKKFNQIVMAQDTGGAIKGEIRADLFLGYGKDAMRIAGELKSPLQLWILLPKGDI